MRTLGIALLFCGSVFAQYRGTFSGAQPVVKGGFGSVVFPAGTPATNPGLQRITPNVVYPGGGGPRLVIPGSANNGLRAQPRRSNTGSYVYAYPVYVGNYSEPTPAPEPQAQPNITIVMPPQQPPVIINQYDPTPHPRMNVYQPEAAVAPEPDPEPTRYLLAFKDHTIYSAVAYWVDGDTLHYFTAGNTHNQVSVSLIDRPMTERLNKDSGVTVKLP
jgi:hypothetical protein